VTPSITPSAAALGPALLFIEPASKSSAISGYLNGQGISFPDFFGFNAGFAATTNDSLLTWMEMYATSGVTGLPQVYTSTVPQSGPRQNLFDEFEVPAGTVSESAWYIVAVPQNTLGGSSNRVTQIEYGTSSSYGTTFNTSNTLYDRLLDYTGTVYTNTEYRLYSTWAASGMQINNTSNDVFLRGGTVS
jgi:hypothetical protein